MKNKKVVYTVIFGSRDKLKEPEFVPEGWDFVCFSDQDFHSPVWEIRKLEPVFKDNLALSNRYLKILPHKFLSEYEISLYIDGHIIVIGDINVLVEKYLASANMALFDMSYYSNDPTPSLKEQFDSLTTEKSLRRNNIPKEDLEAQYQSYLAEGYPDNQGMIMGAVLFRIHNKEDVITAMGHWWHEVKTKTKRDQMSFNYISWKLRFKFNYIQLDLANNAFVRKTHHNRPRSRSMVIRIKYLLKKYVRSLCDYLFI